MSSFIRITLPLFYFSLLVSLLLLSGCAGISFKNRLELYQHEPDQYIVPSVPFQPQKIDHCGPASLAMVLEWSGVTVTPDILASETFTPSRKGSFQSALIGAARRHGRVAYPITGPELLLAEISAGNPVIILQNQGISLFPAWHYAVVIGYDLNEHTIILHSGNTPNKQLPLDFFEYTWAKSNYWGLLILPPSILPATAQEQKYISAVVGLEKVKLWKEAVIGYRNALSRWPNSMTALTGLGNSYYALNELELAEQTFRDATFRHPLEGSLFNNLAQVLLMLGKNDEALISAQHAVKLGGPLVHIYQKTLMEIQADN